MARPYKRRIPQAEPIADKPKVYDDIDHSKFAAKGRGVPINGYVLIAGLGVIDEATWQSRLKTKCKHGYGGWKCIECNAKAI